MKENKAKSSSIETMESRNSDMYTTVDKNRNKHVTNAKEKSESAVNSEVDQLKRNKIQKYTDLLEIRISILLSLNSPWTSSLEVSAVWKKCVFLVQRVTIFLMSVTLK